VRKIFKKMAISNGENEVRIHIEFMGLLRLFNWKEILLEMR
jgi:hypothetical protein